MDDQPGLDQSASPIFVGRDAELAELSAGLEDAIGGRGRPFLIAGEPGIGKTMLAEQLAVRALERGARVLWGRCWEGGGAPAYWPWTQILRTLVEEPPEGVRVDVGADAVDITKLVPERAKRFGAGQDPSAQSAAARFRLFDAVTVLLRRASAVQPLLLVLDDLHAAEPASLLLLRFVAGQLRSTHLLVVATYRDSEAQRRADVAELLGELVREGPSVRLRGFGRAEVRQFMERLTGMTASEDDVSSICDATGGNPLFIREMVRLVESDAAPGWRGHPAISEGVRAVIHQRLAALDADAIQILSVAVVVGQDFELPLVEQVSGLDLPHILQSLAHAERFGLVIRAPGSSTAFRFSHGLVREVLYDDLPIAVRRELHGKVGVAIERMYGPDLTSHLGALAYHFAQVAATGAGARAAEYARRAGDQAIDSYAYEEAALQYRRALEALQFAGPDAAQRCDLFLRLGGAQARAGDYQEAKGSFVRAAEIARRLPAAEQLARAALGFGEPQVEGGLVDQQLLALLQEALDALSPDDSALRVRVLARLSLELTFSDEERRRESLSREALEMARRLGDVNALAIACRARWMAVWGPDGLEERSALSEEILSLARETGDREMELVGRARRITCSMEAGHMRAVENDIAAIARLAGEPRMPYHEWTAATLRAGRALLDGSFAAAEQLAEQALSLLPGQPNARQAHLNQITLVRWEQGRLGELREAWQRIVEQFPQVGFGRAWLSLADAELGRDDDARMSLRSRIDELPDLPRHGLWLPILAVTSLAAAHLNDPDAAAAVYPLLLPYAGRAIVTPMPHPVTCFGHASLYLGLLATALSRWEEADDHFESAIKENTRMGATALLARTRYEYARMLVRCGRTADRSRALMVLDGAEATARALGMVSVGQGCARLRESEAGTVVGVGQPETTVLPAGVGTNVFRKEGDYWTLVYEGSLVRLRDSKGLQLLARLLAEPGREFHAIDLEAAEGPGAQPLPRRPGRRSGSTELEVRPDLGDAGELLDARAKAEYKARLEDLRAELDEAERINDPARAAKIKEEIDFIARELARAVGLGGRDRKAASHAERARLNVTRAIKAALANINTHHPSLGRHLRSTIRTGTYCSYSPDPRVPIDWKL
jgi:tetratricopeptide (TPR) repeat protein